MLKAFKKVVCHSCSSNTSWVMLFFTGENLILILFQKWKNNVGGSEKHRITKVWPLNHSLMYWFLQITSCLSVCSIVISILNILIFVFRLYCEGHSVTAFGYLEFYCILMNVLTFLRAYLLTWVLVFIKWQVLFSINQ